MSLDERSEEEGVYEVYLVAKQKTHKTAIGPLSDHNRTMALTRRHDDYSSDLNTD